jgi:hypothetical protein
MTELGPPGSKYQTNFTQLDAGNGIPYKQELIVKIAGAETVTGQIRYKNGQVCLIDQSHANDEDNNAETVNFNMKVKGAGDDDYLPPGEYTLIIWYFDNDTMMGGSYTDKFLIK